MAIPTGWYPDPTDPTIERWWDGFSWTDQVRLLAVSNPLAPAAQTATSGSGGRWLLGGLLGLVLIGVGALAFLLGSRKAESSDSELAAERLHPMNSENYEGGNPCSAPSAVMRLAT